MSMTSQSSQYFEQVAGQWDSLRSGYFSEGVRAAAIAKAYLRPEMTVADVGSGTGFMAAGLAPLVSKVIVLDGSAAMLEVARKNLAAFENIVYQQADGEALTLADESVDAVFANMYLHHCVDPLAAVREMTRILKPGGRLVITDADAHNHTWMKTEMADVWPGFERDQIRGWFREAGLVNTIVDCTGQDCCAESENPQVTDAQGRTARISVFVAAGTRRVAMRDQVQAAYSATAQNGGGCGCSTTAPAATVPFQSGNSGCCSPAPAPVQTTLDYKFYSAEELSIVPPEASEISLGCGNPTAFANLKPGEVVLDIGSGGGLDSFLAAGKVGPTGKVIGVDMTPAMLERARKAAQKSGITNVEFRQGHAEALPVNDQTVDVILSNCVINLCEDKGLVFREAFRVLKPGGRLEVSDVVTSAAFPLAARQNAGDWSACVSGALPEAEYLDLMTQAGFKNIRVRRSAAAGEVDGVKVYSAIVSADKTGTAGYTVLPETFGQTPSCCG